MQLPALCFSILNGDVNGTAPIEAEDSVTVTCKDGYKLSGSADIQCLSGGVWPQNIPRCLLIKCPEPPAVERGSVKVRDKQTIIMNAKISHVTLTS